jgi:phosphoribosylformimino-5-aminoimidazole carboxamide ribotide isomerase
MSNFRIIPVLDILDSKAVHAKKGERADYKPLNLKLIQSSNPIEIVELLNQKFNFKEFYIADLDAIIKKKPNFEILLKILDIPNIKVMIDPGIVNKDDLLTYSKLKLNKLILGLETLEDFEIIEESLANFGQNKIIVSIDMFQEKIISNIKQLKSQNILHVIKKIEDLGVKEVILLDLFRVGQKIGGIPPLYLEIRRIFSGNLLIGGGIKDFNDITMYKDKKFSGILIATALYDGSIDIEKVKNFNNV